MAPSLDCPEKQLKAFVVHNVVCLTVMVSSNVLTPNRHAAVCLVGNSSFALSNNGCEATAAGAHADVNTAADHPSTLAHLPSALCYASYLQDMYQHNVWTVKTKGAEAAAAGRMRVVDFSDFYKKFAVFDEEPEVSSSNANSASSGSTGSSSKKSGKGRSR